jgi:2-keto-4-pentenoate hydratase/2-oxohepta-3-ene-1,7-dioic acid hydratase in catechol pathway
MQLAKLTTGTDAFLAFIRDDRYLPVATLGLPDDLSAFLATTDWDAATQMAGQATGWQSMDGLHWLPPIGVTSRIFCIGKNYAEHAKEMGMATGGPVAPDVFIRFPSSFVGHQGEIERPEAEATFDFEGEMALVIGKAGRAIAAAAAFEHIFGLTTANDGSLRRVQKRTSQFTLGKNIDRSGALGPTIVPTSAIATPQNLPIRTWVNEELMQDGTTADMIFDIPALISTLSAVTELQPGDIILTGTPAGVGAGRTPPRFLEPGDTVRIEIGALPSLTMQVRTVPVTLV